MQLEAKKSKKSTLMACFVMLGFLWGCDVVGKVAPKRSEVVLGNGLYDSLSLSLSRSLQLYHSSNVEQLTTTTIDKSWKWLKEEETYLQEDEKEEHKASKKLFYSLITAQSQFPSI